MRPTSRRFAVALLLLLLPLPATAQQVSEWEYERPSESSGAWSAALDAGGTLRVVTKESLFEFEWGNPVPVRQAELWALSDSGQPHRRQLEPPHAFTGPQIHPLVGVPARPGIQPEAASVFIDWPAHRAVEVKSLHGRLPVETLEVPTASILVAMMSRELGKPADSVVVMDTTTGTVLHDMGLPAGFGVHMASFAPGSLAPVGDRVLLHSQQLATAFLAGRDGVEPFGGFTDPVVDAKWDVTHQRLGVLFSTGLGASRALRLYDAQLRVLGTVEGSSTDAGFAFVSDGDLLVVKQNGLGAQGRGLRLVRLDSVVNGMVVASPASFQAVPGMDANVPLMGKEDSGRVFLQVRNETAATGANSLTLWDLGQEKEVSRWGAPICVPDESPRGLYNSSEGWALLLPCGNGNRMETASLLHDGYTAEPAVDPCSRSEEQLVNSSQEVAFPPTPAEGTIRIASEPSAPSGHSENEWMDVSSTADEGQVLIPKARATGAMIWVEVFSPDGGMKAVECLVPSLNVTRGAFSLPMEAVLAVLLLVTNIKRCTSGKRRKSV